MFYYHMTPSFIHLVSLFVAELKKKENDLLTLSSIVFASLKCGMRFLSWAPNIDSS